MKIKIIAVLLALCLLSGCSLARPEMGEENVLNEDMLAGVFITREHLDLFDIESYISDHADSLIKGGEIPAQDAEKYSGRIYAVKTGEGYDFGMEGIGIYHIETVEDGVPTSYTSQTGPVELSTHLTCTDEGSFVKSDGTVYVEAGGFEAFYLNPVYIDSQGQLYLIAGSGISSEMSEGMSMSQNLKNEVTKTVDGMEKKYGMEIDISFKAKALPTGYSVLHMASDGKLVQKDEYTADTAPDKIEVCPDAEYIVIETRQRSAGGEESISRQLVERGENYCNFLTPGEGDGILAMHMAEIIW